MAGPFGKAHKMLCECAQLAKARAINIMQGGHRDYAALDAAVAEYKEMLQAADKIAGYTDGKPQG